MTQIRTIEIAREFSDVPAGRFAKDGKFSGERFRDEFLLPNLSGGSKLNVVLDGVEGFGSSFLEEAFGGLVRLRGFSAQQLKDILEITARAKPYQVYVREIWSYIDSAVPQKNENKQ